MITRKRSLNKYQRYQLNKRMSREGKSMWYNSSNLRKVSSRFPPRSNRSHKLQQRKVKQPNLAKMLLKRNQAREKNNKKILPSPMKRKQRNHKIKVAGPSPRKLQWLLQRVKRSDFSLNDDTQFFHSTY